MVDQKTAFKFLDRLRNGGSVNMLMDAPNILQVRFNISREATLELWSMWMATYGLRVSKHEADLKKKIFVSSDTDSVSFAGDNVL